MLNIIKQLRKDRRIHIAYAAAFILLLISFICTSINNKKLVEQTATVIRTNSRINHLEDLVSGLKDQETGVRGFLLSKDEIFLQPYYTGKHLIDTSFTLLQAAYKKDSIKKKDIELIKKLSQQKQQYQEYGIAYFKLHNKVWDDTLLQMGYNGKGIMDSIRTKINALQQKEQSYFIKRDRRLKSIYTVMNIFMTCSFILALLFAILGLVTFLREKKSRKLADEKVNEYQHQLQLRINELDSANKELVEMRRNEKFNATGRIARSIAHEIRNPLTNIDLAIGQIKSEMQGGDEGADMLFEMVNRNSKRINQLITELLNATRFAELQNQPVSINLLLDEALELANDRITLNHVTISKNYGADLCDIFADKEKIKIAFLNIIVNAVESINHNNGLLTITTKSENDKCMVEITDNGIGMDNNALSRLFEPYFTTKQKGNGLGLTNTQNIILNHKGSIQVESTPGTGTSFIIRFDYTGN